MSPLNIGDTVTFRADLSVRPLVLTLRLTRVTRDEIGGYVVAPEALASWYRTYLRNEITIIAADEERAGVYAGLRALRAR